MNGNEDGLKELQLEVSKFCADRNWSQFHNPKDLAISLNLEAAEVLEHFQWKNDSEMEDYVNGHKDDIGEEIADVLYWVLLLSNKLNIDLVNAFNEKMKQNELKYPIEKAKGNHKKYTEL